MSCMQFPCQLPLYSADPDPTRDSVFHGGDRGGSSATFARQSFFGKTDGGRKSDARPFRCGDVPDGPLRQIPLWCLLCGRNGRLMSAVRRFCGVCRADGVASLIKGSFFLRKERFLCTDAVSRWRHCFLRSHRFFAGSKGGRGGLYTPWGYFLYISIVDPKKRFVKRKHEIHTKKAGNRSCREKKGKETGKKCGKNGRKAEKKREDRKRNERGVEKSEKKRKKSENIRPRSPQKRSRRKRKCRVNIDRCFIT